MSRYVESLDEVLDLLHEYDITAWRGDDRTVCWEHSVNCGWFYKKDGKFIHHTFDPYTDAVRNDVVVSKTQLEETIKGIL